MNTSVHAEMKSALTHGGAGVLNTEALSWKKVKLQKDKMVDLDDWINHVNLINFKSLEITFSVFMNAFLNTS